MRGLFPSKGAGVKYPINEVFETVQGEGTYTGTPAVFLRLQGCGVGCPWCDTKHTWALDIERETSMSSVMDKKEDSDAWAAMDAEGIVRVVQAFTARHVVITGGEPCEYDLGPLTAALLDADYVVQVETSGTEPVRVAPGTWVTVSPKFDMPGGRMVREEALARADEIKHPVGKMSDVENVARRAAPFVHGAPIWLQPLSTNKTATALCIREATRRGWRLSAQTHKFLGVR